MFPAILLSSILALNPVWESKERRLSWPNYGDGYEYVVQIFTDREYTQLYIESETTTNTWIGVTLYDTNLYFARVRYSNSETEDEDYFPLGQFYLNLENGYLGEDIIYFPPLEEDEEVEDLIKDLEVDDEKKDTDDFTYSPIDERDQLPDSGDGESVLGESTKAKELCRIFLFKEKGEVDASFRCDLGVELKKVEYINWGEYFTLEIKGTYFKSIPSYVKIYECKKRTVTDPSTWFGCKKILVDEYIGPLPLRFVGNIQVDGKVYPNTNWGFGDTEFFVKAKFRDDISRKDVRLRLELSSYVKGKEWIDFLAYIRKTLITGKAKAPDSNKPFSFPFEKYIGVSQWHGCTVYQCPHKGIDFGSYKEKVLSIGDGKVVSTGYDKYGGQCFQGGRYVIVKHINGMHSTYFHLDSYSVKVGATVKKGSVIGVSGNSGKWNCQRLGYHLHFETRKNRYSSSHVNPIEYIDADWSMVPTLRYKLFPGRLSGDNPHPSF